MSEVLIEARGLRKVYGSNAAVDGIDLSVRRGESDRDAIRHARDMAARGRVVALFAIPETIVILGFALGYLMFSKI